MLALAAPERVRCYSGVVAGNHAHLTLVPMKTRKIDYLLGRNRALTWYQKILLRLFRPRPARPKGGESSEAKIASVIVQFIRAADRANGTLGKDHLAGFVRQVALSDIGGTTNAGATSNDGDFLDRLPSTLRTTLAAMERLSLYFEPKAPPLGPDFRFEFSEDHEGAIQFTVWGDYRYEGFHLGGQLTRPGEKDPRQNWPTPRLNVSAEPRINSPVTRHAKRLRDFFISNYEATDYGALFKSWR